MAIERTLCETIATLIQARENCERTGNAEWFERHSERALALVARYFPSGSGFDSGTELDLDESKPNRLVFNTGFHHMNDCGYYDGWSHHSVIVTPSLVSGFELRITGRNKNDIKDYIAECFYFPLSMRKSDWHSDIEESANA